MSSPKKHKKDNDGKTKQIKETKAKDQAFTEIDFKFELREAETSLSALQKFIEAADKFPEDVDYDIVGQYVQSSEECAEIFKMLEEKRRKPQEIVSIFSALECIFIRLSDTSGKLELIGDNIVQRILNYHMPVIYFSLGLNNKNQLIKKTLRLLTRMVAFSASSARAVQTELDFGHVNLLPLCQRRDIKDTQDVRTCFIQFIMAFLLIGDDIVVRQMVEQKVVIQKILQGVLSDKHENIQLILSTMLEKVVQNPTISKTAKIHLFTETILKHLSQLYSWQGPKHWKELKEKDTAKTAVKASPEERDLVAQIVHTFLTELCCSFKTGINFYDTSLGTSGKNQNHILTGFLSSLQKVSSPHPLSANLIISVLQACPDQLHHFLSSLAPSLNPRPSSGWVKNMDFMMKIYESQPEKLNFLASKSIVPDLNYVSMALVYILPPDKVLSSFAWGLKHKCQVVRHKILEFLKLSLQRTLNILSSVQNVTEQDTVNTAVVRELHHKLKEAVIKKLPDGATLLSCWNKLGPDKSDKEQEAAKEDVPPVSTLQHLVRLEQVLCLYQELVPSLLSDNPNHVSNLLEGIRSVDVVVEEEEEGESSKQQMLPQLYLLKLLAGTDARQLPWGKENASKHTLMYLLLELIIKVAGNKQLYHITQHLVGKLLQSTGLFPGQDQELSLWLRQLYLSPRATVVEFCAKMLTTFISNPYPYMDRVADIIAESTVDATDGGPDAGRGDRVEEKTISDILSMDLDENWDMSAPVEGGEKRSTTSQSHFSFPFSPLTIIGLEMVNINDKYSKNSDVVCFVTDTVVDVFHTQVDPMPYGSLVTQLPCSGDCRQISYIISWINPDKTWKATKHEKHSAHATQLLQALWHRSVETKFIEKVMTSLRDADLQTLTLVAQQVLLYIHHTVRNMDKLDATEQYLETYFKVLAETVEVIISKTENKRCHFEEMDSEISSEFELLDSNQKSQSDALSDIINIIFQHPTLADAFHKDTLSDTDSGTSVHTLLTEFTKNLIQKLKDISVSSTMKKTFEPYAERVLKAMERTQLKTDGSETKQLKFILNSLESLLPFLDPVLHHRSFLEHLLELPSSILVSKGKTKELGKAGQLVINLASKSLADQKDTAQGRQLLSLEKVSTLLNLMAVSTDNFLGSFCQDLLEIQPSYALAVKQELCVHLFENVGRVEAGMIDTILYQNVVCRIWFEKWLQKSVERISENRELYAGMVTCYIRLEGCKMSERDAARQCLQTIEKLYLTDISHLLTAEPTTIRVVCCLIQSNCIGDKKVSKMWKHLSADISEEEGILKCHVELLVLLYHQRMTGDRTECLFELLQKVLITSAARKVGRDISVEQYCLKNLCDIMEKKETLKVTDGIVSIWLDFVKVCLKALYQDPRLLAVIEKLVPLVYVESCDVSPPVEMLYEMLMSHSQFMQVMLGEKGQEVKEQMVNLLLTLVELCPDCCHPDHHSVLQGAYGATLSQTDQKLLKIMFLYEKNGKGLSDARPFLWGPKAVEHYALRKSLASSLLKQPSMEQIIEAFDPRKMYKSSLRFPISRQLTPDVLMSLDEHQCATVLYDPCFVLPLFCGLLSSDCLVDCRRFVSSHCLAYTLSALSSHDSGVRKAAYTVLARYFEHLATVKFHERLQVTYLLDTLRNSVQQANERLSSLITLFLARVSCLLLHPDEHMYRQMNNFLLLKPSLDTMNVPEFYKLFNSADLQHKVERSWILNLLSDGLREMTDYKIMERRFTFKLLQSFYDSAMSDQYSQTRVLKIVKAACSVRCIAVDLAKNHGLLTWISGAILKDVFDKDRGDLMTSVVHSLWFSMLGDGDTHRSLPVQFVRETLLCCKRLLIHIRHQEFSTTALLLLTQTMVSVLRHTMEPTQNKEQNLSSPVEAVTIKEVLLLLYSCSQLQQDRPTAAQAAAILTKVGIHIHMSKRPVEKKKKWSRKEEEEELFEEGEKMEEEHGNENVGKKIIESEQIEVVQSTEQKDDSDTDNFEKILNHVCSICLHWTPKDVRTPLLHQNTDSFATVVTPVLSVDDVHLSGALVTMSWLLSHLHQVDNSHLKTKVLSWICCQVSDRHQFSKVSRMMILDSSDLSSKFLSSLSSAYNCLLNKTTTKDTEFPVSDESRHSADLVSSLTVLNTIVQSLVDQQCAAPSADQTHPQFVSALQSAKILHEDHLLISQEKTSLLLREWLLGSWSAGQFRYVSEETGYLTQTSTTDHVMEEWNESPQKHRKRKSGVFRGDEGSPKSSPRGKTKKKKT